MADSLEHATYSASGAERWLSCPGSIALSEIAPEERESIYAKEGTEAHACLEFFTKNIHKDFSAIRKMVARNYPEEMIDYAIEAATWIKDLLYDSLGKLLTERRVDSSAFTASEQFGTLDAAVLDYFGDCLTVIDYKYGAGVAVDPDGADGEGNPQLVYYALALSHELNHEFGMVRLVVIQPRAFHPSGKTVREFTMTLEQLRSWEVTFSRGVESCERATREFKRNGKSWPDASRHLTPGKWCRFCKAAPICPTLKKDAMAEAQLLFSDETGLAPPPKVELLKTPDLSTILKACDKLEIWISRVREHAFNILNTGGTIEGFKLVERQGRRKWKEGSELDLEFYFGEYAYETPKLKSPAQLEKAFPKKKDLIKKHTITNSSGLTMVATDDKRKDSKGYKDASHLFGAIK